MRITSRLLLAAALLTGAFAIDDATPTVASDGISPSTLGMYVGYNRTDRLEAAEAALGTPLRWSIAMADRWTPQKMVSSVGGQVRSPTENLGSVSDRINLVMTVPLAFGSATAKTEAGLETIGSNLEATAAGAHDDQYRRVAMLLASSGYPDAVIRLGHEFTGNWYPWSAQGNAEEYIAAFRHVHALFRQESTRFRFEWNSARNTFVQHGPDAYPGDAFVDIVGLDVYYEPWKGDKQLDETNWTKRYQRVMEAHRDFAVQHGKPVAYSEWGTGDVDEPDFIRRMYGWFDSLADEGPGALEYQAYFNSPKSTYSLDGYPAAFATYNALFGAQNEVADPPQNPPVTTVPVTTVPVTTVPVTTVPVTTPPVTTVPVTTPPVTTPPVTTVPVTTVPVTSPPVTTPPTVEMNQLLLFDQAVTHRTDAPALVDFEIPAAWDAARVDNASALLRLVIVDKPTDRAIKIQVCAWTERRDVTCGLVGEFSDEGSHLIQMPPIRSWWSSPGWSWDRQIAMVRIVVKDAKTNSLLSTKNCGTFCFNGSGDPSLDAPITFDAGMLLVAPGASPTLPVDWAPCVETLDHACSGGTVPVVDPPDHSITDTVPRLSMKPDVVAEGGKLVFALSLSEPVAHDVVVEYSTRSGTATPRVDYRPAKRVLVIPAGKVRGYVGVQTLKDSEPEVRETVVLGIDSVAGATVEIESVLGVITG